ncbi:Protein argonaute 4 [Abeliophyllum distichum]|uniref:Protein argonaute 4 n=1 Tax=Abeliophyllum distichum TaxID=126358 RepID=A0ABD1VUJ5_9LAMI
MDHLDREDNKASKGLPPPPPLPPSAVPMKPELEPEMKKVALFYEDGRPVDEKGVGRKVLDRVHDTYDTELAGKDFAYDGEKSLFTVGLLARNSVVLEDVTTNRNNGNASPGSRGSPNERVACWFVNRSFIMIRGVFLMLEVEFLARGFHSSFRTTQGALSLNIDVSTTMIIRPGPVVDFLIQNQNAKDPFSLDWAKAECILKNLRVKISPSNQEYKITGLSEKPCKEQLFALKKKSKDVDGEIQTIEVAVYDYFVNHRHLDLHYSGDLPCINVGKPKRPTYFPLELCSLVSLQRYTKALSSVNLSKIFSGGEIETKASREDLKVGNGEDFVPRNGRWNFNHKKLANPSKIERWAVVNFSARCDVRGLVRDLMKNVEAPFDVFEENPQYRRAPPVVRIEKLFEDINY